METLQHLLARFRQLLNCVHDADFVCDAEVSDQRPVGILVNASLVPAQVNRHPVWNLVVERFVDPLARSHGFLLWHSHLFWFVI